MGRDRTPTAIMSGRIPEATEHMLADTIRPIQTVRSPTTTVPTGTITRILEPAAAVAAAFLTETYKTKSGPVNHGAFRTNKPRLAGARYETEVGCESSVCLYSNFYPGHFRRAACQSRRDCRPRRRCRGR